MLSWHEFAENLTQSEITAFGVKQASHWILTTEHPGTKPPLPVSYTNTQVATRTTETKKRLDQRGKNDWTFYITRQCWGK